MLENIIADYRQYEGAIAPGTVGEDLLRLMRERYFDFEGDREVFVEYPMHRLIDAAIEQLPTDIATIRENGSVR